MDTNVSPTTVHPNKPWMLHKQELWAEEDDVMM